MKTWLKHIKRHWRELVLAASYVLPWVSLMVLGGIWIFEKGYAVQFAIFLLVATGAALAVQLIKRNPANDITMPALPGMAEAERRSREALDTLIEGITVADASSTVAIRATAVRAIKAVAEAYHPDDTDSWLNVAIPEILLLTEETSRNLRQSLITHVPVLRHVQISTMLSSGAIIKGGSKLTGLFRIARWLNPSTAIMNELRAAATDQMTQHLTGAAKVTAVKLIIREIGETAIKLYSGGYRRTEAEIAAITMATVGVRPPPQWPVSILIAGQRNAGKSSLLNALAGDIRVPVGRTLPTEEYYRVEIENAEAGKLILIDSPGVGSEPTKTWLDIMREVDLVLWTTAANRADRAADQRAIRALRAIAKNDPRLREIPVVLVATHADRLDPPMEWTPPYDPVAGGGLKERSMREALAAISGALGIPAERSVIVSVEEVGKGAWNVEDVWARIHAALPEAKRKQLERGLRPGGWFERAVDTVKTVPGVASKLVELIKR